MLNCSNFDQKACLAEDRTGKSALQPSYSQCLTSQKWESYLKLKYFR